MPKHEQIFKDNIICKSTLCNKSEFTWVYQHKEPWEAYNMTLKVNANESIVNKYNEQTKQAEVYCPKCGTLNFFELNI